MPDFAHRALPVEPTVVAPDGSDVRVLLGLSGGTLAHFTLAPGEVSRAVMHRTVEEIWYVLAGSGEMWRSQGPHEAVVHRHSDVDLDGEEEESDGEVARGEAHGGRA